VPGDEGAEDDDDDGADEAGGAGSCTKKGLKENWGWGCAEAPPAAAMAAAQD
jgi:hypothetical protein